MAAFGEHHMVNELRVRVRYLSLELICIVRKEEALLAFSQAVEVEISISPTLSIHVG